MNKIALVVDDTSYIREDIKDILEEQGYKVYEASDGLEAVEMYKKVNPSVVTMDINMPRMHGLKAAQVITDLDKEARIMICSTMVMFPKPEQRHFCQNLLMKRNLWMNFQNYFYKNIVLKIKNWKNSCINDILYDSSFIIVDLL